MKSQSSLPALTNVRGLAFIIFCASANIVHKTPVETEICCRSRGKCGMRFLMEHIRCSHAPPKELAKGLSKYQRFSEGGNTFDISGVRFSYTSSSGRCRPHESSCHYPNKIQLLHFHTGP